MVAKQSALLGKLPKGLVVGLAVSIGTTLIGSAVSAWLFHSEKIGEGSIGYVTLILLFLSAALGAIAAVGLIGQKRLVICLSAGGIYLLFLLAITALFFGGTYSGVGESVLVVMAGVLSVALLSIKGNKKPKRKRR